MDKNPPNKPVIVGIKSCIAMPRANDRTYPAINIVRKMKWCSISITEIRMKRKNAPAIHFGCRSDDFIIVHAKKLIGTRNWIIQCLIVHPAAVLFGRK